MNVMWNETQIEKKKKKKIRPVSQRVGKKVLSGIVTTNLLHEKLPEVIFLTRFDAKRCSVVYWPKPAWLLDVEVSIH